MHQTRGAIRLLTIVPATTATALAFVQWGAFSIIFRNPFVGLNLVRTVLAIAMLSVLWYVCYAAMRFAILRFPPGARD